MASLGIQGIVAGWMDVVSIYLCPLGAVMAGFAFAWIMGEKRVKEEVAQGCKKPLGAWFIPLYKCGFCFFILPILLLRDVAQFVGPFQDMYTKAFCLM